MDKTNQNPRDFSQTKIIACATVIEEMVPFIPRTMSVTILDFGLHVNPAGLKMTLQKSIDDVSPSIKHIILGYGLCSQAVVGLKSHSSTLVMPKVDDCIAIFLGSTNAYRLQHKQEPGTYYLTKGWLKTNSTPFQEFESLVKKYGDDKARRIFFRMLKNYKRLAFIDTGLSDLEQYRAQAREIAERFDLKYEIIPGSDTLVRRMIFGPWDEDFLIVPPGTPVSFNDFMRNRIPVS